MPQLLVIAGTDCEHMERSLDHTLEALRACSQSAPEAVELRQGRTERALTEILVKSADSMSLQEAAAVTKKLQASSLAVDLDQFAEAVLRKQEGEAAGQLETTSAGARASS